MWHRHGAPRARWFARNGVEILLSVPASFKFHQAQARVPPPQLAQKPRALGTPVPVPHNSKPVQTDFKTGLAGKDWNSGSWLVGAYDAVPTLRADESALLAIMRAAMRVFLNAFSQREVLTNRVAVNVTAEIDPFAAIHRPRPSAKRLANSRSNDRLFQKPQMLAKHRCFKRSE